MQVRDEYILALYALSKVSPEAWQTFVVAFKEYTHYQIEQGLSAPTDMAEMSLGMGRMIKDLRDDFISVEAIAAKVKK